MLIFVSANVSMLIIYAADYLLTYQQTIIRLANMFADINLYPGR